MTDKIAASIAAQQNIMLALLLSLAEKEKFDLSDYQQRLAKMADKIEDPEHSKMLQAFIDKVERNKP